ncbi:MAG: hypothetical protein HOW73_34755 [Polyangiaceae bacterium]|nr:hypothetical protein [Polyangiaceae bacterium]
MSRLMGQLFHQSPLLVWPLVSLTIFFVAFAAILIATYRKRASDMNALSALPLASDEEERDRE